MALSRFLPSRPIKSLRLSTWRASCGGAVCARTAGAFSVSAWRCLPLLGREVQPSAARSVRLRDLAVPEAVACSSAISLRTRTSSARSFASASVSTRSSGTTAPRSIAVRTGAGHPRGRTMQGRRRAPSDALQGHQHVGDDGLARIGRAHKSRVRSGPAAAGGPARRRQAESRPSRMRAAVSVNWLVELGPVHADRVDLAARSGLYLGCSTRIPSAGREDRLELLIARPQGVGVGRRRIGGLRGHRSDGEDRATAPARRRAGRTIAREPKRQQQRLRRPVHVLASRSRSKPQPQIGDPRGARVSRAIRRAPRSGLTSPQPRARAFRFG